MKGQHCITVPFTTRPPQSGASSAGKRNKWQSRLKSSAINHIALGTERAVLAKQATATMPIVWPAEPIQSGWTDPEFRASREQRHLGMSRAMRNYAGGNLPNFTNWHRVFCKRRRLRQSSHSSAMMIAAAGRSV